MIEYIDRNEAKTVFCSDCSDGMHRICEQDGGCGVYKRFCAIPAADVVPVKHGHYVGEYDGYADGNPVIDMWYCSECGCYFEDWDEKPTYKYCPQCGAKMDEEG